MAFKVGEIYGELDVRDAVFNRKVDAAGRKWGDLGDKMTGAGQKLSVGVTLPTLAIMGMSVKAASSLNETRNKSAVVFGSAAKDIAKFAQSASDNLAMSEQAALDGAAGFGNLFNTSGLAEDASAKMSSSLVALAADMASFNDQSPEEMLEKLRSGLVGEAEPLRTVGVLLSEARVQEEAYSSGIAKRGEELTEAQKVQARYNLIMKDTEKQQGDLERTSDSLSNQLKTLRAESTDAAASFGEVLVPAVTPAVELLGKGADVLQSLPDGFKKVIAGVGLVAAAIGPLLVITGSVLKNFQRIRDFRFRAPVTTTGPVATTAGAAEVGSLGRASAIAAVEVANLGRAAALSGGTGGGLTTAGKRGANLMNQGARQAYGKSLGANMTGVGITPLGKAAQKAAPQLELVGKTSGRAHPRIGSLGSAARVAGGRFGRMTTALGNSSVGAIGGTIGLSLALGYTIPKVMEAGDAFMQWMDALETEKKNRESKESSLDTLGDTIRERYGSVSAYLKHLKDTYGEDSPQYKNAISALSLNEKQVGRGMRNMPVSKQATGGDYVVSRPTLFLAGEAGSERATFTPLPRGGSAGAGDNSSGDVTQVFNFYVDKVIGTDERAMRQFWSKLKPVVMSDVRRKEAMGRG